MKVEDLLQGDTKEKLPMKDKIFVVAIGAIILYLIISWFNDSHNAGVDPRYDTLYGEVENLKLAVKSYNAGFLSLETKVNGGTAHDIAGITHLGAQVELLQAEVEALKRKRVNLNGSGEHTAIWTEIAVVKNRINKLKDADQSMREQIRQLDTNVINMIMGGPQVKVQ